MTGLSSAIYFQKIKEQVRGMTFNEYIKLSDRAREAGIAEDNPALSQLLHLLKAEQRAKKHFKAYLCDMNKWEKNCAKWVEDAIRKAGEKE